MNSWIKCSLGESNKEAAGIQLMRSFDGGCSEGNNDPNQFPSRAPDRRSNISADYLGWYLTENIADGPHGSKGLILISHNVEILFHS